MYCLWKLLKLYWITSQFTSFCTGFMMLIMRRMYSRYESDEEEWSVVSVTSSKSLWSLLFVLLLASWLSRANDASDRSKHGNDTLSLSISHANCKASASFVGDIDLGKNDFVIDSCRNFCLDKQLRRPSQLSLFLVVSCCGSWLRLTAAWFMLYSEYRSIRVIYK